MPLLLQDVGLALPFPDQELTQTYKHMKRINQNYEYSYETLQMQATKHIITCNVKKKVYADKLHYAHTNPNESPFNFLSSKQLCSMHADKQPKIRNIVEQNCIFMFTSIHKNIFFFNRKYVT